MAVAVVGDNDILVDNAHDRFQKASCLVVFDPSVEEINVNSLLRHKLKKERFVIRRQTDL